MLTWAERLVLWNQLEILKHLNRDRREEYQVSQEILSRGIEDYYHEVNPSIAEQTVAPGVTKEVEQIFTLFRVINASCAGLRYTPKSPYAKFRGFDGNNEGQQYGFARFVRQIGDWDDLKDCPDNSHTPMLGHYRRMLATWDRLGRKYELTDAEIEEIAEAR